MTTATAGGPDPALVTPEAVTGLGHATALIAMGGRRVLVDPLGRARTRRAGAVDAVLITHSHAQTHRRSRALPLNPRGRRHLT